MRNKRFLLGKFFVVVALMGAIGMSLATAKSNSDATVSAELAADYIHAIVEAHRTIYSTHVVDRMLEKNKVAIAEDWKQQDGLPLPAQFLLYAGRLAAEKGGGVRVRLASQWPIYERNAPVTDFEREGLLAVTVDPNEPYGSVLRSGRRTIYKAIYADKAVSESCVNCHNSHPLSPKKDYKLGDVMGGIIITFPLY